MDNKTFIMSTALVGFMGVSQGHTFDPVLNNFDTCPHHSSGIVLDKLSISNPVKVETETERIANLIGALGYLEENWDGYNGLVPPISILSNTIEVVKSIDDKYLNLITDEDVFPTTNGTVMLKFEDVYENELTIEVGMTLIGLCGEIEGTQYIVNDLPVHNNSEIRDYVRLLGS